MSNQRATQLLVVVAGLLIFGAQTARADSCATLSSLHGLTTNQNVNLTAGEVITYTTNTSSFAELQETSTGINWIVRTSPGTSTYTIVNTGQYDVFSNGSYSVSCAVPPPDSCAALSSLHGLSTNQNVNLTAGEVITYTTNTSSFAELQETSTGINWIVRTSPGTTPYTIVDTGQYDVFSNGAYSVSCVVPPKYTVTVNTDTTTGTASNCTVLSTTDANCSLRDAVAAVAANTNVSSSNPATINFSPTVFLASNTAAQNTIISTNGTFNLPSNTTIQGLTSGSGASLTNLITINGNGNATGTSNSQNGYTYSVITVASGVTGAALNNLTITGGYTNDSIGGGGIYNQGTLTINSSSISGNNSYPTGGGIYNTGTLTINNSTIASNVVHNGNSGGGISSTGPLTLNNSTVSGNTASSAGNPDGGGIYLSGFFTATVVNSTITNNTSNSGGGIYVAGFSGVTLNLTNSIVAGNSATGTSASFADLENIGGSFTAGSNLVYNGGATATPSASVPNLAPLGNYGGPTQTMPVLPSSPAFCKSESGTQGTTTTDQRGVTVPTQYSSFYCTDSGATNSAYSIAWTTQPASSIFAGVALNPVPAVQFQDNGFAIPATGTIQFNDASTSLLNHPVNATLSSSGSANLSGSSFTTATTGDILHAFYTLNVGSFTPTLSSASSSTFNVVSVNHFTLTSVPATATAGTGFNVTVTAYSSTDNSAVATSYTGPITFTSTDTSAVFPTGTLNLTAGVGTFSITLKTSGTKTITVADLSGSPSLVSSNIAVSAAAAATITASSGTPQSAVIGAAFTNPLMVQVLDAYSNPVSGNVVTFTVPSSGASSSLSSSSTCTTSSTSPVGTCSVTATANGTASSTAYTVSAKATGVATAASFSLTNSKASPSLTVTASPTTLVYGQPVTIKSTSSITSAGGSSPTGAVTFYDNTTTLSPTSTPSSGVSTFSTTALVGSQTYAAAAAADSNFNAVAESYASAIVVGKASSTLTGPTTQPVLVTVSTAGSVPVSITGQYSGTGISTPSGSVGYTITPSAGGSAVASGTATISSGAATVPVASTLAAGSYNIALTYAGDSNYAAATGITVTLQVGQIAQTISFSPATPVTYGVSPITLSATGGSSGNPVIFSVVSGPGTISGSTLTVTGGGTIVVAANQAGNTTYLAATQVTGNIVVNQAEQTISFSPATPVTYGVSPITLSATATSALGVTFSVVSGPGTISGSTLTVTGAGTIVVAANQAGNTSYTAATQVTGSIVVNKAALTVTANAATSVYGAALPTFTGTITGVVGSDGITATYGTTATPTSAAGGSYTITATLVDPSSKLGNYTVTNTPAALTITKATPTDVLAASASSILTQNTETLTATISFTASVPTGSVNFLDGTTLLSTVPLTNGVAVLSTAALSIGSHSITAVYSGDTNFVSVISAAQSITVQDFNLTISISSGSGSASVTSVTALPGSAAVYTFTLSPVGSATFPATVTLSASGLPAGATATFSPATLAAGTGSTNVTMTIQLPATTSKLQPANHFGRGLGPFTLALLLLPFAGRMRRAGRKLGRGVSLALLLTIGIGATVGLTGCGYSTGFFGQAQQTYTVTVTGTSGALAHSTTVTLTVE